jgi:transcriptional regulator with XRE-family HTH domain
MKSDSADLSLWQQVASLAKDLTASLEGLSAAGVGSMGPYCKAASEIALLAESKGENLNPRFPGAAQSLAFARLLRSKRELAGLSREQLAKRAKLSSSTIKFLETARHPPSRGTILRLAAIPGLNLSWAEAESAQNSTGPRPAYTGFETFDPRLTIETVLEGLVILDEIRSASLVVESSALGCQLVCRLCGSRSVSYAVNIRDAIGLPLVHGPACCGKILASFCERAPVVGDLAKSERAASRSSSANELAVGLGSIHRERFVGRRPRTAIAAVLATIAAAAPNPYLEGVAAVLTWATGLGPYPVAASNKRFTLPRAHRLSTLGAGASGGPLKRDSRLQGVAAAAAWLVSDSAENPLDVPAPSPL